VTEVVRDLDVRETWGTQLQWWTKAGGLAFAQPLGEDTHLSEGSYSESMGSAG
jgi:hypothetical protein